MATTRNLAPLGATGSGPAISLFHINELIHLHPYASMYAVSIKEDTTYLCLHSPKTTKETRSNTSHDENSNLIKEIRASTDAAIRNQGSSIKTLEIQIGQMSKVLQERGFRNLPSSTKTNPRDRVKSFSTVVKADSYPIHQYFNEDYNKEREIEPRLEPTRAATLPLRVASPKICRWGERTVGFEGAKSRGESRVGRNTKGGRPLEEVPKRNEGQCMNLPPVLAAHLKRGENGQPLQSSLTSAYGGQALLNNIGGNLPSNGLVTPFVHWIKDYPLPDGLKMLSHIGSYDGKEDPDNFLHLFEGAIRMQKLVNTGSLPYVHIYPQRLRQNMVEQSESMFCSSLENKEFGRASLHGPSIHLQRSNGEDLHIVCKKSEGNSRYEEGCKKLRATSKDVRKHLKTQIQEAVNSRQLLHLVKGIKKERTKSSDTPREESKKDKGTAPCYPQNIESNNGSVNLVKKVAKSDLDSDSSIRLRFVLDCVLSGTAFCLSEDHLLRFAKDKLYQNQNCTAFCLRLRFTIEDCVLKNLAFCLRIVAV
nr:reverse transcriptase domain-containing protein [Tanacetum cinerariifolium]